MQRTIIIRGKRFTSKADLEENPRAMREVAQELIELADFQLTCLPKITAWVQEFELGTIKDVNNDGIWTTIAGAIRIAEEPASRVEVINL